MRIYEQKTGNWNEQDRLQLASLLIKAGYTVRIGKEKPTGKTINMYFVEFNEQRISEHTVRV